MDNFFNEPMIVEDIDDLSRVYHHLLGPVKDIETLCEYKSRKEEELHEASGSVLSNIVAAIAMAVLSCWLYP